MSNASEHHISGQGAADPANNDATPKPESRKLNSELVYHDRGEESQDPISRRAPVALRSIAKAADIRFRGCQLGNKGDAEPADGFLFATNKRFYIIYEASASRQRTRFTIAHELAHALRIVTGNATNARGAQRSLKHTAVERQCDKIAAEILMPADLLAGAILRDEGCVNTFKLANEFDVSLTAMRIRLKGLGLL